MEWNGMKATTEKKKRIRAVLIDLSGTLHIGDEVIPGAREALKKLRSAVIERRKDGFEGLAIRFLTNTSTKSVSELLVHLNNKSTLDFRISPKEMITSVKATADYVKNHCLNPLLLMEDTTDFLNGECGNDECNTPTESTVTQSCESEGRPYDSVVVGLAPSHFHYERLNVAFRVLLQHPNNLIAVHRSNYLRDIDRELSLGPGAFITALETASNCVPAKVMGKPSEAIFRSALLSIHSEQLQKLSNKTEIRRDTGKNNFHMISMEEVCMIGDDVLVDCRGALMAGVGTAILVQTGKYRDGDECKLKPNAKKEENLSGAFFVCSSIVEAVDLILKSHGI